MSNDQPKYAADLIRAQELMQVGRFKEAEPLMRPLIIDCPNELNARLVYANCLVALERLQDAVDILAYNIAVEPRDAAPILQTAILLDRLGKEDLAFDYYNRAIELDAHFSSAHWSRSFFLLRRCDKWRDKWQTALEDYEWCRVAATPGPGITMPVSRPTRTVQPMWDGKPIPGKVLYITNEQGAGDGIMMARLVRVAKERSQATVILETGQGLFRLMQKMDGPDRVVMQQAYGAFAWPFDEHIPLMSLPYVMELSIDDIERSRVDAYLGADIPTPPRDEFPRVGVCWKGNPQHPGDGNRSIPRWIEYGPLWSPLRGKRLVFDKLFLTPGVQFTSLQYGESPFTNDEPLRGDYWDTAHRLKSCDLVITVDSSVAHLAGALGVPCWMLAGKGGDWRWFDDRLDSIWYKSVRLIRQQKVGIWEVDVDIAKAHLEAWIREQPQRVMSDPPANLAESVRDMLPKIITIPEGDNPNADVELTDLIKEVGDLWDANKAKANGHKPKLKDSRRGGGLAVQR